MTGAPVTRLPGASVVICAYTHERWADTVAAVESVRAQDVAAEVIVVVDHNPALLARARRALPRHVRVLRNAGRRGLSGGRNTAVSAASGEVVVFLDDDAAARPGWLRALLTPYADPDVVAVGGVAYPRWPRRRPGTLPASGSDASGELDWIVGCTYAGQSSGRAEVRNLMGCSMSVRREAFAHVGGFAEDLGRVGRTPLGCEETEFCIRLRQAYRRMGQAARIVLEPAAKVDHRVSPDRTGWAYLRRRSWSEGLSKATVARRVGTDAALSTERTYVTRILPRAVIRELSAGRPASAAAIVTALLCTIAGFARGAASAAAERPRTSARPPAVVAVAEPYQARCA